MPHHPHIKVDATVVIAGDPNWSVRWVAGFVEIATKEDPESISIGTGLHLELDHAAFTALAKAMKQAQSAGVSTAD